MVSSPSGVKNLVANLPAIKSPPPKLPQHIFPCDPIIHPAVPVSKGGPALARWLDQGPSVHINH